MQLPLAARRLGYRAAYTLLLGYWFIARPSATGVKCVLTDGGRVILVRHTYGPPMWELPGGMLRRHEPPADAARREMAEELGVTIDAWTPLGIVSGTVHHRRDTLHCFHAELTAPALTIDRGEIDEARWFDPDALPPDIGDYVRPILGKLTR